MVGGCDIGWVRRPWKLLNSEVNFFLASAVLHLDMEARGEGGQMKTFQHVGGAKV